MEVFDRPLGAPRGDRTKSGYLYERSFENLDVSVNMLTGETSFNWRPPCLSNSLLVVFSDSNVTPAGNFAFTSTTALDG